MRLGRIILAILVIGLSGAVLLDTLLDPEGWARREKVRADLDALHAENAQLQERVAELRAQITALQNRREVQERAVRDELGYVKPDEVVVELGNGPSRP